MKGLQIATFVLVIVLLAVVAGQMLTQQVPGHNTAKTDTLLQDALVLRSAGLPRQAVELYEQYVRQATLSPAEEANLHLVIGTIYQDDLNDPERALAHFQLLSKRFEGTEAADKVGRRMVQCQEELGRSREAQRTLAMLTDLEPDTVNSASAGVVIGKVGDREITLGQVEAALRTVPQAQRQVIAASPAQMRQFAREFVLLEALYQLGLRRGYDQSDDYRRELAQFERQLLAQRVRDEELRKRIKLSEGDIERYYQANSARYSEPPSVEAAHIQLATREAALTVLEKLRSGSSFDTLVSAYSQDAATRDKAGNLGRFSQSGPIPGIGRVPAVQQVLASVPVGEVTGPLETPKGWHLFRVLARESAHPKPLAEVRTQVEADLRRTKEQEAMQEFVQELLQTEKAAIFEERIPG